MKIHANVDDNEIEFDFQDDSIQNEAEWCPKTPEINSLRVIQAEPEKFKSFYGGPITRDFKIVH